MDQILYQNESYKEIIKKIIEHKRVLDPELTNKVLAARIPIQATYLSKFFNDPDSHLKNETLYRLGIILGLTEIQSDYLTLLKSYETSDTPERKEFLYRKIQNEKALRDPNSKTAGLNDRLAIESKYLLNPKCMLVHMALHVMKYRANARLLCAPLNLASDQLIKILDMIEESGFIKRGEDPYDIKEVNRAIFHIEAHELMRIHQNLFKTLIPNRLQETTESEKKSFLVTFNMDESAYKQCLESFDNFIGQMRKIAEKSRAEGVYQLSFDLFKWC